MNKKLSKYGNSLALILDKPLLELLNIKEDTILKISTDGKAIIITPLIDDLNEKTTNDNDLNHQLLESIMKKYSPTFKKLAQN